MSISTFQRFKNWLIRLLGGVPRADYDFVNSFAKSRDTKCKELETVDNINKMDLLKQVEECQKTYRNDVQIPSSDTHTQSTYRPFSAPKLPGQVMPDAYKFDEDINIPGTYRVKSFNDDSSAFVQYRIQFGKANSEKLSKIYSPERQQYEAVEIADKSDLFGSIIRTLYNTGALRCTLTVDENGAYVLYAVINLDHPTDDMMDPK